MRVLVLGGTTEAIRLAQLLAERRDMEATLSLAGRTRDPAPQPIPMRVGGFGGPEGLATYLTENGIGALVDATHPFAARMSFNAAEAAATAGVPLAALTRAPWTPVPGDVWTEVDDLAAAAAALGKKPRRVLLTVGRLGLGDFESAPQHAYLVRSIDPPGEVPLPHARVILERPPFDEGSERALMQAERIDVLVTKNSGGKATAGKLAAARALGLPVILVRRPPRPDVTTFHDPAAVMTWLIRHARAPAARGV
ncbi:cobalt-precorrin-6A reductase [Chthonobacter albigriseus]|uniref:cobalt-precorrin-6A reductase n=1 Tax=Chthonobacter albigriseus TaxID=1683161 RepID=UPI0015EE4B6D|nr:cobalt-precorrin-6A reductase [Chthonobacter albigriseus]